MVRSPRLREWLEQLLHTHDTPQRTAAAYALGVFFGFSPLLGLHTVLAIALAFVLRLNRVAVLLGVYSNLPWILVPYYSLVTWLGAVLLRTDVPPGLVEQFLDALENRSWAEFRLAAVHLEPIVWAYTLGSTLGALVLALIAYRVAFVMVVTHRKRIHRTEGPEL